MIDRQFRAFSSFPDTSLFSEGSIVFSFKIRHIPPDPLTLQHPEPPSPLPDHLNNGSIAQTLVGRLPTSTSLKDLSTEKAEEYRRWDERGREWLYGFVWFEQRRDKGVARGYMQVRLISTTFVGLVDCVLVGLEQDRADQAYRNR